MYRGSRAARARGSVYGSVRGFCSTCAISAVFYGNGSVYGSVAEGKWPKMVHGSEHGSVYGSVHGSVAGSVASRRVLSRESISSAFLQCFEVMLSCSEI